MTPEEFSELAERLMAPPAATRYELGQLQREIDKARSFPYGGSIAVDPAAVPLEHRIPFAGLLSGTPDPQVYAIIAELLFTAMSECKSPRLPRFARDFFNNPDRIGAQQIADRLSSCAFEIPYKNSGTLTVRRVLAKWVTSGVLNHDDSAKIIDNILLHADYESIGLVASLPREVAVPWLHQVTRDRHAWVAAGAIRCLRPLGEEPDPDVVRELCNSHIGLGFVVEGFDWNESDVRACLDIDLLAVDLAKARMAWKYACGSAAYYRWTIDDPDLEIEQVGLVDGESAETTGVLYVFKYRMPWYEKHDDWMYGIAGPYSFGEEPARHLGGLDFTYANTAPPEGSVEQAVEYMLGFSAPFSSLAAKPKH